MIFKTSATSSQSQFAGEVLFMWAPPRLLPLWMFTAAEPLLGGAIASTIASTAFQGERLRAPLCICWGFAAERLNPTVFTLHSNVTPPYERAPAAREALLSHLLGLHSAGTRS